MYIYVSTCTYAYIHLTHSSFLTHQVGTWAIKVRMYIYVCMCVYMIGVFIYIYVSMCVYIYTYMYVYMYMCTYTFDPVVFFDTSGGHMGARGCAMPPNSHHFTVSRGCVLRFDAALCARLGGARASRCAQVCERVCRSFVTLSFFAGLFLFFCRSLL